MQLLERSSTPEKLWTIDKHIVAAVAGLNSDAMILINLARLFGTSASLIQAADAHVDLSQVSTSPSTGSLSLWRT